MHTCGGFWAVEGLKLPTPPHVSTPHLHSMPPLHASTPPHVSTPLQASDIHCCLLQVCDGHIFQRPQPAHQPRACRIPLLCLVGRGAARHDRQASMAQRFAVRSQARGCDAVVAHTCWETQPQAIMSMCPPKPPPLCPLPPAPGSHAAACAVGRRRRPASHAAGVWRPWGVLLSLAAAVWSRGLPMEPRQPGSLLCQPGIPDGRGALDDRWAARGRAGYPCRLACLHAAVVRVLRQCGVMPLGAHHLAHAYGEPAAYSQPPSPPTAPHRLHQPRSQLTAPFRLHQGWCWTCFARSTPRSSGASWTPSAGPSCGWAST